MQLIAEYFNRTIMISIAFAFLIEIIIFLIVNKSYLDSFDTVLEKTLVISENKTFTFINKISQIIIDRAFRYCYDLVLIGRHLSFYREKNNHIINNVTININTDFFNQFTSDLIIDNPSEGDLEKKDSLKKYYSEETNSFDYIETYLKDLDLDNIKDQKEIIYKLLNEEHKELDLVVGYGTLNELYKKAAGYMTIMIKSILIENIALGQKNIDYIRWILINKDNLFIYPPDYRENVLLSSIAKKSNTCKDDFSNFPQCINIGMFFTDKKAKFMPIFSSATLDNVLIDVCHSVPFLDDIINFEKATNYPILCAEVNFNKILKSKLHCNSDTIKTIILANSDLKYMKYIPSNETHEANIPVFYSDETATVNNIIYVYNKQYFGSFALSNTSEIGLFHLLYYDIFSKYSIEELKKMLNIKDIINEYEKFKQYLDAHIKNNPDRESEIKYDLTLCKEDMYENKSFCSINQFSFLIKPMVVEIYNMLNTYYVPDKDSPKERAILFYALVEIKTSAEYLTDKIDHIFLLKNLRLSLFYILSSLFGILFFWIALQFMANWLFCDEINTLCQSIRLYDKAQMYLCELNLDKEVDGYENDNLAGEEVIDSREFRIFELLYSTTNLSINKEMNILESILDNMKKITLLKHTISSNLFMQIQSNEFYNMLNALKDLDTKQICTMIIAYSHFKNGLFKLSEKEFSGILEKIRQKERKISTQNDSLDTHLKDLIQRNSDIAYLNEFSSLRGMNETILPIIKIRLFKQKIIYLLGLCCYYIALDMMKGKGHNKNNNNNANKDINSSLPKKSWSSETYFSRAVELFLEARKINKDLGMNPIKEIFALIMISRCYMKMKIYSDAILSLNEAMGLLNELNKFFRDTDTNNFNPKILLFVITVIFQHIIFNMCQVAQMYDKPNACGYIIIKLIETCPFLLSNIHCEAASMMPASLKKIEQTLKSKNNNNNIIIKKYKIYNNIKRYFKKLLGRTASKIEKWTLDFSLPVSIPKRPSLQQHRNSTVSSNNNSKVSSGRIKFSVKKDMFSLKPSIKNVGSNKSGLVVKNLIKEITICISEKALSTRNGNELKDVLIKYLLKSFNPISQDLFSFIQFSQNGKRTIYIRPSSLSSFILSLKNQRDACVCADTIDVNKGNNTFTGLRHVLTSVIQAQSQNNDNDRVILLFINSEDIRFTSRKECIETVNDLNEYNYSLFLFSYDSIINPEKIKNINSFINGLFEGAFIQLKNYQCLKQVLSNISTKNVQESFLTYDFESIDYIL